MVHWPLPCSLLALSCLPLGAHDSTENCEGSSCVWAEGSQEDGGLGMLQHAVGASRAAQAVQLVPTLPPAVDICGSLPKMNLTQDDLDYLASRRSVKCDFQTAGFTCVDWSLVLRWWLPVGHNFSGWPVLLLILAVLFLGSWPSREMAQAPELDKETHRQVYFWCHDLPPHRSLYLAMAGATLWLATMVDHPTYSRQEIPGIEPHVVPWWATFLPAVSCILAIGTSSTTRSLWHVAAILTMIPASVSFVMSDRLYMLDPEHVGHGHRHLFVSWTFCGISIALLALWVAPEARVSSWLRKSALLLCCASYICGGVSKILNNKPLLKFLDGEILQNWTICNVSFNSYRGLPYPWLARLAYHDRGWSVFFSVATMLLELPLSFAALAGLGCFGDLGLVRILWCLAAVTFHFTISLIWGCHQASMFNLEVWVNLALVADVFGLLARWRSRSPMPPVQELKADPHGTASQVAMQLLSFCSSLFLFLWLTVAFMWHFDADDPKWPITSVPMFSTFCYGHHSCPRSQTFQLGWALSVFLGLAGSSVVLWRFPCAVKR